MHSIFELYPTTHDLRLLYVEDDSIIREQLTMLLGKLFNTMEIAKDGQEGLECYASDAANSIDIIITDIKMPKMNGLEMARAIKAINPDAHIILLTAHNELDFFAQAIEIGVDGFIIKPVQSKQLIRVLFKTAQAIKMARELDTYHTKIEEKLIEATEELERTYTHDLLTGCFNREKLNRDLKELEQSCLMLVNIDNFDSVNSTYGYRIGDELLKTFAALLREHIREEGRIYRLAGDEFVILWPNSCSHEITEVAARLNEKLKEHLFLVEECKIHATCTIGIADGKQCGMEANCEAPLIKAHAAMKEVREIGKNRFHIYSDNSGYLSRQRNNIEWMHKMREALEQSTILPYFQPIVDNKSGKVVKYECLSRMKDALKIITPNHYIEPARLVGLLPEVTKVMIEKAFAYFAHHPEYGFSINITEDDLKVGFMPPLLERLCAQYGIEPSRVVLEILENISAQGSDEVLTQLLDLKQMGFLLALDDFGSDKSNFYRLQKMDVDFIKIDGSFIKDIDTNQNNQRITRTIVLMAESLECKVIAEFVHSEAVLAKVKELGIHYSQGYLFGEPRPEVQ